MTADSSYRYRIFHANEDFHWFLHAKTFADEKTAKAYANQMAESSLYKGFAIQVVRFIDNELGGPK